MKKNILILWLGAFGYAVSYHLGKNNPEQVFFASEKNLETFEYITKTRKQPYFFQEYTLPENIVLKQDIQELLPDIDIILSIIPCQFVAPSFAEMKPLLKPWVIILNLAKGIDNVSLQTISEKLKSLLNPFSYTYAYISGGMIAQELIDGNLLGADIVTENSEIGIYLQELFESESLEIQLKIENPKNTELYAALKNVIALMLGYYEGLGVGSSTLGYYFTKLLGEIEKVIELLFLKPSILNSFSQREKEATDLKLSSPNRRGDSEVRADFTSYALSWDIIATCFGNSRNRLLGNMLGKWASIEEALTELKAQKKIAEGYETLKGIKKIITWKEGFDEIRKFCEKYI
jgi:glycerol-3-phosphate dehydrogenase